MPSLRQRPLIVVGYAVVMILATISRLWNLGYPKKLVFDETYYVKDALTLSLHGHEKSWPNDANQAFETGDLFGYLNEAAFVVHPPFGKWLIAAGMWAFGPEQSYSWRISSAVLGILTVGLLMLVAHKLFQSHLIALSAGLLISIDGLAITMSRTALLDSSLTTFLLLGFYFFLLDQQRSRIKIARAIDQGTNSILIFRPWLFMTAITLGLASSIKWSGLYLLAGIGLYVVISETILRKNSGEKSWFKKGVVFQGAYSFVTLVPVALVSYLATWFGWLAGSGGYGRNWASENSAEGIFGLAPDWKQSLLKYHEAILNFHVGLRSEHPYQAHPIGWLVGARPTAFFYESYQFGQSGCNLESGCSSAITALGNPLIWIGSTIALIYIAYRYVKHRERVLGLILLGVASLYLPWLLLTERTVFSFYAVSFQPWLILGLVFALYQLRQKLLTVSKSLANLITLGYLTLALLLAIFFLPINTGIFLPYELWQWRMWLPSWI